ncbi:hypothetical protein, partial [Jatrophihabitans endophyticus]|uniref:hypothetical protein n=1 Tax=Jatrophihabitans endophyticus TaxID=1206085 RepID=UPI001160F344
MKLIALLGAVLVALSAAVLPIANPANAQPCTGTVVNIDGCRGARSVTVSGSQPDPGRTSTPPTGRPNTPPSLTVTCGTSAERELTNLGDRLPAVAGSTCQSQRIICRATEKAEN